MFRKLFLSLFVLLGFGLTLSSCAPGVYAGVGVGAAYPYGYYRPYGPGYYGYAPRYYAPRPIIVAPRPYYGGGYHGGGGWHGGGGGWHGRR